MLVVILVLSMMVGDLVAAVMAGLYKAPELLTPIVSILIFVLTLLVGYWFVHQASAILHLLRRGGGLTNAPATRRFTRNAKHIGVAKLVFVAAFAMNEIVRVSCIAIREHFHQLSAHCSFVMYLCPDFCDCVCCLFTLYLLTATARVCFVVPSHSNCLYKMAVGHTGGHCSLSGPP